MKEHFNTAEKQIKDKMYYIHYVINKYGIDNFELVKTKLKIFFHIFNFSFLYLGSGYSSNILRDTLLFFDKAGK